MANPDFAEDKKGMGRAVSPPATGKRKSGEAAMPMKPGPAGGLPGAKQPKSRSNGVPGGPFYVKKEGL